MLKNQILVDAFINANFTGKPVILLKIHVTMGPLVYINYYQKVDFPLRKQIA